MIQQMLAIWYLVPLPFLKPAWISGSSRVRSKLSTSLIQFSVDEWGCVPSLLFDLRPKYGDGNKDNSDFLQKVPCRHYWTQCPQPCNKPLLTHTSTGDSWHLWASLGQSLLGHCPFFLGSGVHKVFFVPSKSLFPPSCVSSGSSMVGLMATSSKRAYVTPRSTAPRAPAAGHCWPVSPGDTQTQFCLSLCGVCWSCCVQGLFEPSKHCWQVWGLILNVILPLLLSCWGFSLPMDFGVFFWWDPTFFCWWLFSSKL